VKGFFGEFLYLEVDAMEKQKEPCRGGIELRSVVIGGFGAVLCLGLLLLAAALGERRQEIFVNGNLTAKVCLFLSALCCGWIAGGRAGQRKLLNALTAEMALLAILLLCALGCGNTLKLTSVLLDLLLMLFGAFAGTVRWGKRSVKRRGIR
jgi:hypothetical protein